MRIDPSPFTLRELKWMLDEYQRQSWDHTAAIMTLLANINRGKGQPPVKIEEFHPYRKEKDICDIELLKKALGVTVGELK